MEEGVSGDIVSSRSRKGEDDSGTLDEPVYVTIVGGFFVLLLLFFFYGLETGP